MTVGGISTLDCSKPSLTLPDLPEEYLDVLVIDNEECQIEEIVDSYPLAASDVTEERLLEGEKLSEGESVKEVYSIVLSSKNKSFKPGDTIGIITHNEKDEVNKFFNQLGITNLARKKCKVCEKVSQTKKTPLKPVFLNKVTTLENIFTHFLDLRSVPKKVLLRVLAEYTKNEEEKNYLKELCSKEKSDLYTKEILEKGRTFVDVLFRCPSCRPPVARIIENLPKLMPRAYSIASSPLTSPDSVRVVFSIGRKNNGELKTGLCTGMLREMISKRKEEEVRVKMFFRKCNGFNLPDEDVPIILIGPGTGIAPFIGFLEHRKIEGKKGIIWLFFGCRHKEKDFIFEKELNEFIKSGVLTKLSVAFSRDGGEIKYVQDNIRKHGSELCNLIFEQNAKIYICGDAKNMRKDVQNVFIEIFENRGLCNKEAIDYMKKLQKDKRYLQDIWM